MAKIDKVNQIIFYALDMIDQQSSKGRKLGKSPSTILLGKGGTLDSLEILNLIIAIEQSLEEEFSVRLTLVNEKAMSPEHSPFRTIGTLTEYILQRLGENESS